MRPGPVPDGPPAATAAAPLLRLDGFEGPLDLLLELARARRLDLARLSLLEFADQFAAAVQRATDDGALPLDRAAEWLVMAAWLAWLKSRLLLPEGTEGAREAEGQARAFADRLAAIERGRAVADWLAARPQRGRDVWYPSAADDGESYRVGGGLPGLLEAMLRPIRGARARAAQETRSWRVEPLGLPSAAEAAAWLAEALRARPGGGALLDLLPPPRPGRPEPVLERRAAIAATLVAALEAARGGTVALEQDGAFQDVRVVPARDPPARPPSSTAPEAGVMAPTTSQSDRA